MTGVRPSNPENRDCLKFDDLLASNPPVIKWEHNGKGIQIPVYVDDPHVDNGGANKAKTVCKWGHPFDEVNTIVKPNGSRECRTCKQRHNQARSAA